MENNSGLKPAGHRLLMLPDEVEKKTASGIVIADATTTKEQQAQISGTLIEAGPDAFYDSPTAWAKPGDKIIIGKFYGLIIRGKDGKDYRMINDRDVVGIWDN